MTTTNTLREFIQTRTGYDPTTEPAFAWSATDACSDCGVHDVTAVLSFDDDGAIFERLCHQCAVARD